MITVACVWVEANVPYSLEYVTKLRDMVRRNLREEHEFVVFTDRPEKAGAFRTMPVQRPPIGRAGWWSKIELFNPAHDICGRVLYLDLDVLIIDGLDEIVNFPAEFALVPDGGTFRGRGHLRVVKKYNSSVMVWDDRARPKLERVHRAFGKDVVSRLWGDQDLIGEMLPYEETMPSDWFPRLSEVSFPWRNGADALISLRSRDAKVILSKKPKNEQAAEQWPWFREMWG